MEIISHNQDCLDKIVLFLENDKESLYNLLGTSNYFRTTILRNENLK